MLLVVWRPTAAYRAICALATTWARADHRIERSLHGARRAGSGLLAELLDDDERRDLGPRLYDAWERSVPLRALFPQERTWLAARLPPAPARVLVGGAGTGREVVALAALGHGVDAFDPRADGCARCAAALEGRGLVVRASYEELGAAVLDDAAAGAASALAARRYDAVLLGWGSLRHVLDPAERRRVLVAADRLAPAGPVLGSFSEPVDGESRAERAGRDIGRALARMRGRGPSHPASFAPHCGFLGAPTRAEIEAIARELERQVVWEPSSDPHFTLLPRAPV